jgi:hypothetical protein
MTNAFAQPSCEVTSRDYINFLELQGVIRGISHAAKTDGTPVCTFSLDTGEPAVNSDLSLSQSATNCISCKIVGNGAREAGAVLRNGQLFHCFARLVQVNYVNEVTGRSGFRHEVIVFRGSVITRPLSPSDIESNQFSIDYIPFPAKGGDDNDAQAKVLAHEQR